MVAADRANEASVVSSKFVREEERNLYRERELTSERMERNLYRGRELTSERMEKNLYRGSELTLLYMTSDTSLHVGAYILCTPCLLQMYV